MANSDPAHFQPATWDAARSDEPGGGRFREEDAPLNAHLRRVHGHYPVQRVQRPDEQARARRKMAQVHALTTAHDLQEFARSVPASQFDHLKVTLLIVPVNELWAGSSSRFRTRRRSSGRTIRPREATRTSGPPALVQVRRGSRALVASRWPLLRQASIQA